VRQRLAAAHERLGFGRLVGLLHFGSLPHELTVKNMHLFAEDVLPFVRGLGASKPAGRNGANGQAAAPLATEARS
jgi:hypothetical protein